MKLDLADMTRRQGCFPGLEWWDKTYGNDDVDYQDVLSQLALEDRVDWARWLIHEVGAPDTMYDVKTHDIKPIGVGKHAFFAGNVSALDIKVSGVLLVAGRLEANEVVAQSVIADGGIRAKSVVVVENIICTGGLIMVKQLAATNIRSGNCILADKIHADGTVRAVTHITCPDINAESVVEYCTGLKPHKPRVGAAKTGHMGNAQAAPKFSLRD